MIRKFFTGLVATAAMLVPVAISAPAQAGAVPIAVPILSQDDRFTPPAPGKDDKVLKGFGGVKGKPGKDAPLGSSSSRASLAGPYYHYALARQTLGATETSTGLAGNLTIEDPGVDSGVNTGHSLGELAVQSANGQQTVEAGWRKPAGGVRSAFVYHWVNGVPQGYQTGFVEYGTYCNVAGRICAGDSFTSLAAHTQKRFTIVLSGGAWWVGYDLANPDGTGGWWGYFPATRWTSATPSVTFNEGKILSAYFETVHTTKPKPCTDMGNALPGATSGSAARIGSLAIQGLSPASTVMDFGAMPILPATTPATIYSSSKLSGTTIRAGGVGWASDGVSVGAAGGCP